MYARIWKKSDHRVLALVGPFDQTGLTNWLQEFDRYKVQIGESRIMADTVLNVGGVHPLPSTTIPQAAFKRVVTQL